MSRLPIPLGPSLRAVAETPHSKTSHSKTPPSETPPSEPRLRGRARDYVRLSIFVLAQHGYHDRAGLLAEALYETGDRSPDLMLARAVLRFGVGEWAAALACLTELDDLAPIERFGSYRLSERQRMRRYLKARCLYELEGGAATRDAVDIYLRPDNEPA